MKTLVLVEHDNSSVKDATLAVSGGRTPVRFLAALAQQGNLSGFNQTGLMVATIAGALGALGAARFASDDDVGLQRTRCLLEHLQRGHEVGLQVRPVLRRHRLVDRAPVDRVLGRGVANDKFVLHASTGELAGVDQQRAVLRQPALATLNGGLDERCGRQVPVERRTSFDTLAVKPELRHPVDHVKSPSINKLNGGDRSGLPPHTYAQSAYNPEGVAPSKRLRSPCVTPARC